MDTPLLSREHYIAQFHARVNKGASRPMLPEVLALCEKLVFESRCPHVTGAVTADSLANITVQLGRCLSEIDHSLAIVCLLRGQEFARGSGFHVRQLIKKLEESLSHIRDQTLAAEEESEDERSLKRNNLRVG